MRFSILSVILSDLVYYLVQIHAESLTAMLESTRDRVCLMFRIKQHDLRVIKSLICSFS